LELDQRKLDQRWRK